MKAMALGHVALALAASGKTPDKQSKKYMHRIIDHVMAP